MRKLVLSFIFLIATIVINAATYYIDPAGTDGAGIAGGVATPWKTLSYACTRVTTSGDIIHVNSGSYTETVQSVLRVGVSIEGVGDASYIHSNVGGSSFTIQAESGSPNTNGNQHISYIKMDGNSLTAYGAIRIAYRGNVEVHHCTIVNFNYYGVSFINGEPPPTYATGNKFYNNTVTNCSAFSGGNHGCLEIQGQDGMLIYNNTMNADRGGANCGDVIYAVEGFLKNVKIYNNTLTKTCIPGVTSWDFAIEIWNPLGGVEIYDNVIIGSIDISMAVRTTGTYSVWIHDNTIGQTSLLAKQSVRGVLIEINCQYVIIERNYIHDVAAGVYFQEEGVVFTVQYIYIQYNIFNNIGSLLNDTGWGVYWSVEERTDLADHIYVWNNTIIAANNAYTTRYGIGLPDIGTASTVSVRNNIVTGFDDSPVYATGVGSPTTTINILSIENNLFYGNGNANLPHYVSGMVPTNNTTQNNIISNPLFESGTDFHVQVTSPANNAGLNLGLTLDYDSVAVANPPEIGAYEYVSKGGVAPIVTTTAVTSVSSTTAVSGGDATDDGGAAITAKGVCWGTSVNPTIAGNHTSDGSGTGAYSSSITGLVKNTTYHVRAYATNSVNTTYGADIQFTTPNYLIVVW